MTDFRKLLVWQKANALEQRLDPVIGSIRTRKPRLADQMERSAESIAACIAEGRGRSTDRDFAHYLTQAIGSANEVENHLQRARDSAVIGEFLHQSLSADVVEIRKMLIGLRKRLLGTLAGETKRA